MDTPRELFLKHVAQTSHDPMAIEVSGADGIYLFDPSGKRYLDLSAGVCVNALGHRHPAIREALIRQMDKYLHLMVYGEFIQEEQAAYAGLLVRHLHPSLDSVYFVNSGSEAIEGAMKLAKRVTGRSEIISFCHGYHGSTQGALSIMGSDEYKLPFRPLTPGGRVISFNSLPDLEHISRFTAAVVVEPVQAEAGVILPHEDFLISLREQCSRQGALLIFDEVQTGFGRTGFLFAFQKYNVVPDIIVLAKALGGGLPLGAFVAGKNIMSALTANPPLGHITTFGGHPLSCAAGRAALDIIIREGYPSRAAALEQQFTGLLKHPLIRGVRTAGLLIAVQLDSADRVNKFLRKAREQGLITDSFLFDNTSFRISPPLVINPSQVQEACEMILHVLNLIK